MYTVAKVIEREFIPSMDLERRDRRLKGWHKAVRMACLKDEE